jgi:pimeloyl-ACP methyl ester carboxylesterase
LQYTEANAPPVQPPRTQSQNSKTVAAVAATVRPSVVVFREQFMKLTLTIGSLVLAALPATGWGAIPGQMVSVQSVQGESASPVSAEAEGRVFNWSARTGVDFRAWVPAGRTVVNGVYVNFNCSGCDSRGEADDSTAQEFARTLGFAIVGTRFSQSNETGHSADLLAALQHFAAMSGHPEIAHAPVAAMGASLGGYNAMQFAVDYPDRTLAYVSTCSSRLVDSAGSPGFVKVPGLYAAGSLETWVHDRPAEIQQLRRRGALVSFYWGWEFGHGYVWDPALGWNFLSDVVRKRYPSGQDPRNGPIQLVDLSADSGWLADPSGLDLGTDPHNTTPVTPAPFTRIQRYADYAGDRDSAMWLPSAGLAYMYRGLSSWEHPVWYPTGFPYVWNRTTYVSPPLSSGWTLPKRGETVRVVANIDGQAPTSVRFYDGAKLLATRTSPPYQYDWSANKIGIHAFTIVARYADGRERSGAIAPVLVRGAPAEGRVK